MVGILAVNYPDLLVEITALSVRVLCVKVRGCW